MTIHVRLDSNRNPSGTILVLLCYEILENLMFFWNYGMQLDLALKNFFIYQNYYCQLCYGLLFQCIFKNLVFHLLKLILQGHFHLLLPIPKFLCRCGILILTQKIHRFTNFHRLFFVHRLFQIFKYRAQTHRSTIHLTKIIFVFFHTLQPILFFLFIIPQLTKKFFQQSSLLDLLLIEFIQQFIY